MGSHQLITVPGYNWVTITSNKPLRLFEVIEGLPAKRAYIAFLADFHFFLQDQANFWQTDLC